MFEVKYGEKAVDIDKALPLTVGDMRRLKREFNVSQKELTLGEAETVFAVLMVLGQKADASITEADVDGIAFSAVPDIILRLGERARDIDRPT